jgi:hypothetical protein
LKYAPAEYAARMSCGSGGIFTAIFVSTNIPG